MIRIAFLLVTTLFFTSESISTNGITGTWLIYKIIQNDQDVTAEYNPHNERYITLKENGSFENGGRPYGKNTGKYNFNREDRTLFLDSDIGPEDDSKWLVTIKEDTMYWKGFGSEWAENFQIVQVKSQE